MEPEPRDESRLPENTPFDFSLLFHTQRAIFSVAGSDGILREVNPAFEHLVGRSRQQLLGYSIFEFIAPEDIPSTLQGLHDLEDGDTDVLFENRWQHADGSLRNLEWIAKSDPSTRLWYATARDVTESRRTQEALRKVQERLTLALTVAQAGSWDHNISEGQLHLDAGAEVLLGLDGSAEPRKPESLLKVVLREDRARLMKQLRELHSRQDSLETSFRLQDERPNIRHIALRGRVVSRDRRGRPLQAIGIAFDITNQKALEEQLLAMVMYDPLTAIRNRRSFDQTFRSEWKRALKLNRSIGVLMIDVDEFKLYNDKQGHLVGDDVLCSVARTLSDCLQRSEDLIARYGGEEFVVLLPGASLEQVILIAGRMLDAVRALKIPHPFSKAGIVTASIGVAAATPDGTNTSQDLLGTADAAMYRAKTAGRNRVGC